MPVCPHKNLLGPQFIGDGAPSCADCGEKVPCPHPKSERTTNSFLGNNPPPITTCNWCGHQF